MTRLVVVGSVLVSACGVAIIIPAIPQYLSVGDVPGLTSVVIAVGVTFLFGGAAAGFFTFRRSRRDGIPAPVRATIMATIVFLAFCALEFSDGLLNQDGRVFYWTSALFLPALGVLYGLVTAQRWAWWVARAAAALSVLWFCGFLLLIPFANLRTDGIPVPWQGRLYMAALTFFFASIAGYAFQSLGRPNTKEYFGNNIRTNVA